MTATETAENAGSGVQGAPLFQLEGVGFEISGRTILDDLDLMLEPGRVHGLIGPNGSGKSTLVKLLARQAHPRSGHIGFSGRPIDAYREREFARQLAYLPQTPPPTDGMTSRELVALGRYPHHGPLGRLGANDEVAIEEAMVRTGTGEFARRPVETLSGGERQRVWLAMMIAQGARCLVLDEPTSALDVAHQAEMLELVRRLCDDHDHSVVIVLHDINMAARTCDRLIALEGGKIVADGPPAEIVEPQMLERIYGVRMGVFSQPGTGAPIGYVA
ncbi:ABC transporter ATP-binding protein [Jiella pacifica]|uniref:ATP-binding cassette domain-containing protein n=1 Tax=Jiella pacifica TaxID=2696469 RepID=A0A6N9T412_9HYPH|nr:ATP-binding cassette domain-containing protein [Jiella pacifica]NDW06001.1 ATP-binding cassette domain-containing protein [Jiella pacifica]